MRRQTFDVLISAAVLLVAGVMLIAGILGLWAHSFTTTQVHDQLSEQNIYFPPAGSKAIEGDEFAALQQYAGQQLTTGAQAEAYANHFIAAHLTEVAGGKTYAEVSSAAQSDPTNTTLQGRANSLFKGETLRGLLLTAYAFSKVGQIAFVAGIVFIIGAVIMVFLSLLAFRHARRVPEESEVLAGHSPPTPQN